MNFFAHSIVAGWFSDSLGVAWGAMLPDLAHMVGLRGVRSEQPQVALGIALHHQTDAAFHNSETFLSLQREARVALDVPAISRGSRLAVAHIGPELMLDAELSLDPVARAQYVKALKASREWVASLSFRGAAAGAGEERLGALQEILLERVAALTPQNEHELALRLARILAGRRRLSLSEAAVSFIEKWARETWPKVRAHQKPWLRSLEAELSLQPLTGELRALANPQMRSTMQPSAACQVDPP